MKFLHVSDLGLRNLPFGGINPETGLNRRFEDVIFNFKYVVSMAIKEGVEYFIIAGDINEERNPESILVEKFSECIADLISSDIKVIIVAGNHDLDSSKGTSSSISYIKALGLVNTNVSDLKPDTFEYDDIVFHCVPYMFPNQVGVKTNVELTEWINKSVKDIELKNKTNVFVSHYSLETTFAGMEVDEPILWTKNLGKFDYVALGHIHKYEMFGEFNGGYTGSLFCKDFGEQNDKYFNIITVENGSMTIEQHPVPERKFIQFDFDLTTDETIKIEEKIENVKDAIVKVSIKTHQRFNPKLIYDHLRAQKVFHYVPIEWKIVREDKTKGLEATNETNDSTIVEQFFNGQELEPAFKDKVISYVKGVIESWEKELISH